MCCWLVHYTQTRNFNVHKTVARSYESSKYIISYYFIHIKWNIPFVEGRSQSSLELTSTRLDALSCAPRVSTLSTSCTAPSCLASASAPRPSPSSASRTRRRSHSRRKVLVQWGACCEKPGFRDCRRQRCKASAARSTAVQSFGPEPPNGGAGSSPNLHTKRSIHIKCFIQGTVSSVKALVQLSFLIFVSVCLCVSNMKPESLNKDGDDDIGDTVCDPKTEDKQQCKVAFLIFCC